MITLRISLTPGYARIMCGRVLSVRENDHVMAEHSMDTSNQRIMLRHILPNSIPPLIVMITMMMDTLPY
jgi:peptide/nickel transport system permease protein